VASIDAIAVPKFDVMMQPDSCDNQSGFGYSRSSSLTTASDLSDYQVSVFSRIFGCFSKPAKELHPENRPSFGRKERGGTAVIRPAIGEPHRRQWSIFSKRDRNTRSEIDQHAQIHDKAHLKSPSALEHRAVDDGATSDGIIDEDTLLFPAPPSSPPLSPALSSAVLPEEPSRTVSADELPADVRRMLLQAREGRQGRKIQCFRRIDNCSACGGMRGNRDESIVTNISALHAVSEGALYASALVRDFSSDLGDEVHEDTPRRVKAATL
jgi:hypothetical protein